MPPEPPTRRAPARDAGGGSGVLRGRPLRIAVAVAAALTLVATGVAWRGIDSLRSSLATVGGLTLGADPVVTAMRDTGTSTP